jgi:hypothetical protein
MIERPSARSSSDLTALICCALARSALSERLCFAGVGGLVQHILGCIGVDGQHSVLGNVVHTSRGSLGIGKLYSTSIGFRLGLVELPP